MIADKCVDSGLVRMQHYLYIPLAYAWFMHRLGLVICWGQQPDLFRWCSGWNDNADDFSLYTQSTCTYLTNASVQDDTGIISRVGTGIQIQYSANLWLISTSDATLPWFILKPSSLPAASSSVSNLHNAIWKRIVYWPPNKNLLIIFQFQWPHRAWSVPFQIREMFGYLTK
jgi:hypothetical protein